MHRTSGGGGTVTWGSSDRKQNSVSHPIPVHTRLHASCIIGQPPGASDRLAAPVQPHITCCCTGSSRPLLHYTDRTGFVLNAPLTASSCSPSLLDFRVCRKVPRLQGETLSAITSSTVSSLTGAGIAEPPLDWQIRLLPFVLSAAGAPDTVEG